MINNDANEAYRNQVKANYEFSSWAGHTKEGDREVRITGFRIGAEEVKGWRLEESEELPSVRELRVLRYIYSSDEAGPRRLLLTTFECNSVLDAHESLIDVVMTYMAPTLPRCESRELQIGDICFGSHGELNLSLIFARFNILAEIKNAGTEPTSVDEFARSVDSLIYNRYVTRRQ